MRLASISSLQFLGFGNGGDRRRLAHPVAPRVCVGSSDPGVSRKSTQRRLTRSARSAVVCFQFLDDRLVDITQFFQAQSVTALLTQLSPATETKSSIDSNRLRSIVLDQLSRSPFGLLRPLLRIAADADDLLELLDGRLGRVANLLQRLGQLFRFRLCRSRNSCPERPTTS